MLDVHPPHAPTHTWRDFFLHIATITVGLLIAVGLEQTVEAVHRSHERADLRESLDHETQQILDDSLMIEKATSLTLTYLKSVEDQLSEAVLLHRPLGPLPEAPKTDWDQPHDSVFEAAKASTLVALLSEQERVDYGELDTLLLRAHESDDRLRAAGRALEEATTVIRYGRPAPSSPQNVFEGTSPAELKDAYEKIELLRVAFNDYRFWCRTVRGATSAIHSGERDLKKILAAERQFDTQP